MLALFLCVALFAFGCDRQPAASPAQGTAGKAAQPDAIDAKVLGIVSKQFDVSQASLSRNTRLTADLKADDLDLVELVMEVEDTFSLSVQDEETERWRTVGQVIDYVRAHRKP